MRMWRPPPQALRPSVRPCARSSTQSRLSAMCVRFELGYHTTLQHLVPIMSLLNLTFAAIVFDSQEQLTCVGELLLGIAGAAGAGDDLSNLCRAVALQRVSRHYQSTLCSKPFRQNDKALRTRLTVV